MSKQDKFPVVAIGSSAGGVNTLGELLSRIDPKIEATYLIVQHLSPTVLSQLPSLLQARSTLPVVTAESGIEIKPKTIYLAVPGKHLIVQNGRLLLDDSEKISFSKPSITKLFMSVAKEYKDRSVGIILTGAGSDGAKGIESIKEVGGWTIAQDPAIAAYPSMPQSAVNTGKIDFVLSVRDMPSYISEIANEPKLLLKELSSDEYNEITDYLTKTQNTKFSQYKQTTIKRRIKNRISALGLTTPMEYLKVLKNDDAEVELLINNLLINVTQFFRDREAFEELNKHIKTLLLKKEPKSDIRIWVAGCSTGEEAYSIAIALHEILGDNYGGREVKIFATDVDNEAIEKARHGYYEREKFEYVSDKIKAKYFHMTEKGYKINKFIRASIIYGVNDLTSAAPIAKVDMITCRNVLIYFDKDLQKKVLRLFHYALNKDGVLFLGKSESNLLAPDIFTPLNTLYKIYQKINMNISLALADKRRRIIEADEVSQASIYSGLEYNEISRFFEKILQHTNDYIISVNRSNKITSINQGALQYFGLTKEKALNSILADSFKGFVTNEVAIDIDRTIKTNDTTTRDMHYYKDINGLEKYFYITYIPFGDTANVIDQVIIIIREITQTVALKSQVIDLKQINQEQLNQMSILNEELQSSNEELETTNEELQATNEELETTNEELQSTNEELETTNEELSSTNSEMVNTNIELRSIYDEQEAQRVELEIKTKELATVNENLEIMVEEKVNKIRVQDELIIHQSKLASMGEMIGNIAHQWRQPLNALGLNDALIVKKYMNNKLDKEYVEKFDATSKNLIEKMSTTIDDFRNFFNPNKPKEDFNLNSVILESLNFVEDSFNENHISIKVDNKENDLIVHGYKNELVQVLLIIFNNAKDAVATNNIAKSQISIKVESKDSRLIISIEDNGGGIDEKILSRIFEPYFTTKFESQGTGIGLYMAKVIIEESMKGFLSIENSNDGVLVKIEIPKNNLN